MSFLKVFKDHDANTIIKKSSQPTEIQSVLQQAGVRFEQWPTRDNLSKQASVQEIIQAYQSEINQLIEQQGYQTVDAISLDSSHPKKDELRKTFLAEHTHAEDEVRFFVKGQGLFTLHIENYVYEVLCEQGDLISVPANTPHWFDMGPNPDFMAIRLFNNPEGWLAHYTDSNIAQQFSTLEN